MSVYFMLTFEDLCLQTRPVWWGNTGKTPWAVTGWQGSGELWPRLSHLRLDRLSSCLWHRAESLMTTLRQCTLHPCQSSTASPPTDGEMLYIWTSHIITDSSLCLALLMIPCALIVLFCASFCFLICLLSVFEFEKSTLQIKCIIKCIIGL